MGRKIRTYMLCGWLVFLSGCSDRIDLEDTTLSLAYGFDMREDGTLLVYQASTAFTKSVKKNYEVFGAKVHTARQAKEIFNSMGSGVPVTGKNQVILFGKHLLEREGAMPILDVAYRDSKNSGNARIAAVDGPVSSIMNSKFTDKPMLPLYLTGLIDVEKKYNSTAYATVQRFHTLSFDKGITPAISLIKKGKDGIVVTGSALLDHHTTFKMALSRRETMILSMLQRHENKPVNMVVQLPRLPFKRSNVLKNKKGHNYVSLSITGVHRNIKQTYENGRFSFEVKLKLHAMLAERTFAMNMKRDKKKLEQIIAEQMGKECNALVTKVQKQRLDPFGFGWQVRAFQYEHWKKVKDHWPDAFAEASVRIVPEVEITNNGATH
ncbi:Ger(x)C family spore germination protein [Aneurinibacillus sp. BA2021]|nr:Ger(x)C family spore germination protein [Aneurinibacillus sp. BA2021]